MKHRLAIVGFGNVGQGLVSILAEKRQALALEHGFEFDIVAVTDLKMGSIRDPRGLDLQALLSLRSDRFEAQPTAGSRTDALTVIRECDATVVVEATYTDLETAEPATSHIKAAFETGKHVVTTNKGPLALHYPELTELAKTRNLEFRFEGTVMSGTPLLSLGMRNLSGCEIREIRGILNGTTNFILTQMEKGVSYEEALKKAQELGYAEADPTGDVEGFDTMGKVLILSNVFMGGTLKVADIRRKGIKGISLDEVRRAASEGKRWKLLGSVRRDGSSVVGSVGPEMLPLANPLASVAGATNAAQFATDLLGEITIVGAGAGRKETGFAVLSDLLDIHREIAP